VCSLAQVGLAQPIVPKGIWMDRAELLKLPTSGTAWSNLVKKTQEPCPVPNLSNQDDSANVCIMGKALVFARQGDPAFRQQVRDAIWTIVNAGTYTGRALALGRELAAYVIAADLIDLKTFEPSLDADFRATIKALLTTPTIDGPDNLIECHERRPNNWGTHCGGSRVAVAAYLGDLAELARVAKVFKGWLGDRASYSGFSYGDLSWQCDPAKPVGINPAGCMKEGHSIDGVLPEEQRRAGTFTWPPPQENYVYGGLQGALAQAVILRRAGYDVFEWQNQALLRAFRWLHTQAQFPASGDDTWEPHLINYFYAYVPASFPAPIPASAGKNVGWTDWTHAGKPSSTGTTSPSTPTTSPTSPATGTRNYAPIADTFVRGGNDASVNFGSSRNLEVKDASSESYDRRTFLRFDLRSDGAAVASASLRVYVSGLPNGQPVSVCAFGVNSNTWTESGLTWQNQPAPGALLSCQNVSATGWISFDVTSFVKQRLTVDKIVSLTLRDSSTINRLVQIDSREASNKPVLTLK
jgi:hypothetical protein